MLIWTVSSRFGRMMMTLAHGGFYFVKPSSTLRCHSYHMSSFDFLLADWQLILVPQSDRSWIPLCPISFVQTLMWVVCPGHLHANRDPDPDRPGLGLSSEKCSRALFWTGNHYRSIESLKFISLSSHRYSAMSKGGSINFSGVHTSTTCSKIS